MVWMIRDSSSGRVAFSADRPHPPIGLDVLIDGRGRIVAAADDGTRRWEALRAREVSAVGETVNLTQHEIRVVAQDESGDPVVLVIPPGGDRSTLRERAVPSGEMTVCGIRVTIVSLEAEVSGVPDPDGRRYLVSRETARALRGRRDVLFPDGEIRSWSGAVVAYARLVSAGSDVI